MKNLLVPVILALLTSFESSSQSRVVLIEQFSNSSCPPCAAISPSIYAFGNSNEPNVAIIAYHTLFPYHNDSLYFENTAESDQRVNYYSVASVPSSVLDGNVYNGPSNSFFSNIVPLVGNRLTVTPRYNISTAGLILNGDQLSGMINFTSVNASNLHDSLVGHIVVIEKKVPKSSYSASPGANSETEYGYVMRKMIPDGMGTRLSNKVLNGTDTIDFSWFLNHVKDRKEIRVVAFVQNKLNKEIYQAMLFNISDLSLGINGNNSRDDKIYIYPNPAINEFSISFPSKEALRSLQIKNSFGETLFYENLNQIGNFYTKTIDLPPGLYYVVLSTESGTKTQKLLISR